VSGVVGAVKLGVSGDSGKLEFWFSGFLGASSPLFPMANPWAGPETVVTSLVVRNYSITGMQGARPVPQATPSTIVELYISLIRSVWFIDLTKIVCG